MIGLTPNDNWNTPEIGLPESMEIYTSIYVPESPFIWKCHVTGKIVLGCLLVVHHRFLPLNPAVAVQSADSPTSGPELSIGCFLPVGLQSAVEPAFGPLQLPCALFVLMCFVLEWAPLQPQLVEHVDRQVMGFPKLDTVPVSHFCLLFTVGTQNRQQPPISLICSQRTAVSRKRNKKKKVPPKTVEPLTVKQKPSALETEKKTAVASEQSDLQAAERTSTGENHVLGFGIVLESPSSDVSWCFLAADANVMYLSCQEFYGITTLFPLTRAAQTNWENLQNARGKEDEYSPCRAFSLQKSLCLIYLNTFPFCIFARRRGME